MMAGLGFTIFTLETYKTFFFPSKPRGKFAGKPILFPDMLRRRQPFVAALRGDLAARARRVLSGADRSAHGPRVDPLSLRAVTLSALGAATAASLSHAAIAVTRRCARRRRRVVASLWPDRERSSGYVLYAIPAHLLISVLANEPVLFAAAKVAPPLVVAIAGTAGCLVADRCSTTR